MDPQNSTTEIWKPVPGFDGAYAASNKGRIQSFKNHSPRVMKFTIGNHGYRVVKLRENGKTQTCLVHFLVLLAFGFIRKPGEVCRHFNDVKTDNRLENLCFGTPKENIADARRNGRLTFGTRNGQSKLTDVQVLRIRQQRAEGAGLLAISGEFGVSEGLISMICSRKRWGHL